MVDEGELVLAKARVVLEMRARERDTIERAQYEDKICQHEAKGLIGVQSEATWGRVKKEKAAVVKVVQDRIGL